jgi:hypothetical protein
MLPRTKDKNNARQKHRNFADEWGRCTSIDDSFLTFKQEVPSATARRGKQHHHEAAQCHREAERTGGYHSRRSNWIPVPIHQQLPAVHAMDGVRWTPMESTEGAAKVSFRFVFDVI